MIGLDLVTNETTGTAFQRCLDYTGSTNNWEWNIGNGSGWLQTGSFYPTIEIKGKVISVLITTDYANGEAKFYINNILQKTYNSFAAGAINFDSHLLLGKYGGNDAYNFTGMLSQPVIMDKLLTTDERATIFDTNKNLKNVCLQPKVIQSTGENNASSTFSCVVKNIVGENKDVFNINDEVGVWVGNDMDSLVHLFEGFITVKKDIGQGNRDTISITGKDFYSKLQDKTIEPTVFRNVETSEIVKEILLTNAIQLTTNNVNVTPYIVPAITYKHNKADVAVNNLAALSSRIVYVDVDKDLHFEEKNSIASGVVLESGVNILSENFTEKRAGMANQIWVYGNKILTKAETFNFTSDGIGSVYELPKRPHNTSVYVNDVLQKGNVFEFANDIPSGTSYLVDFDQKNIIFISGTNAGNNIPASGITGSIIYDEENIIARYGQDDESIKQYDAVEDVIIDMGISTTQHAQSVLDGELAKRSDPFKEGTIITKGIELLQVGRTVSVLIPNAKINSDYNVLSIEYDLSPKALAINKIQKIKVAKKIANIADTIKKILEQLRAQGAQNINVGDLLSIVRYAGEENDIDIHWDAYTKNIGTSFVLGDAVNGVLGTIASGIQPVLGDQTGSYELHASGGDF